MALESSISSIITSIAPTATYQLASKFRANLDSFHLTSDQLPFIVLDNDLSKNNEIKQNYSLVKETRIVLWFLQKDDPDNTDVTTNSIQNDMELIADRAALSIYRLENVRPSGNQRYKTTPLFHVYNTDLSGCALEMNVNENLIVCNYEPYRADSTLILASNTSIFADNLN